MEPTQTTEPSVQDRLAITTYRVCYSVDTERVQREWEFATERLANIARRALLVRYPSAQVRAYTAFFSSRIARDLQSYESRLQWVQQTKQEEDRLLSAFGVARPSIVR
jgi:hypothetical protein